MESDEEAIGGNRADGKPSPAPYMKRKSAAAEKKESFSRDEAGKKEESRPDSGRIIIYQANYIIEVESVSRSVKDAGSLAARYDGFIESAATSDSYRYARIIIRVPVRSFETALKDLESMGTVLSKEVSASDVTMEYNDVRLRMETAKKVRDRMYELLKRSRDVKERVKILREIERLTSIIDSLYSRIQFMKNRADYSTIAVELRARVREVSSTYLPSPFMWIASLNPDRRSIFKNSRSIEHAKPEGFYHLEKEYKARTQEFLFSTPGETAGIRAGVVENYPPGDLEFWEESFKIEFDNRRYKTVSRKEIGSGPLRFIRHDFEPYAGTVYSIAFAVSGENIIVVEARLKAGDDYEKNSSRLDEFIRSVRCD